jgi:TPR repeat protein
VPQNHAEAVKWYRLAAEQGLLRAQIALAYRYKDGDGVPQNDAEAVKWFRLAAAQGDGMAQIELDKYQK